MRTSIGLFAAIVLICSTQLMCKGAVRSLPSDAVHDVVQAIFKSDRPSSASEIRKRLDIGGFRVDSVALTRYADYSKRRNRPASIRMYLHVTPVLFVEALTDDPGTNSLDSCESAMQSAVDWINIGVAAQSGEYNVMLINSHPSPVAGERSVIVALSSICCDTTESIQTTLERLRLAGMHVSFERYRRKGDLLFPSVPIVQIEYKVNDTFRLWLTLSHEWISSELRGDEVERDTWGMAHCEVLFPRTEGDVVADVVPYGTQEFTLKNAPLIRTVCK
jgi:hypothetical protein